MRNITKAVQPYVVAVVVGLALFHAGHQHATQWRGYTAFGGELFFLFMPALIIYLIRTCAKERREQNGNRCRSVSGQKEPG